MQSNDQFWRWTIEASNLTHKLHFLVLPQSRGQFWRWVKMILPYYGNTLKRLRLQNGCVQHCTAGWHHFPCLPDQLVAEHTTQVTGFPRRLLQWASVQRLWLLVLAGNSWHCWPELKLPQLISLPPDRLASLSTAVFTDCRGSWSVACGQSPLRLDKGRW